MTDYMDDVEYLQGLAKRLGDSPENKIAVAYVKRGDTGRLGS